MSALRNEIMEYLNDIPDDGLEVLKPLLSMMASQTMIIETDLTNEEKAIISSGMKAYKNGEYTRHEDINWN